MLLRAFFTLQNMRGPKVPKIVYLLTDGRSHDSPQDIEFADRLRAEIPNLEIWAYGTGDYVAMPALLNYTKNPSKIVTNKNLTTLETTFDWWRGTEVCEKVPGKCYLLLQYYYTFQRQYGMC